VHINALPARQIIAQLADTFKERQAFNIANGSADLTENEINIARVGPNKVFYLIRD